MSDVPQPYKRPSPRRDGTLSAIGTVARCPARTTRRGRPSRVRATTTLPVRSTSSGAHPRKTRSTSSVNAFSSPDTDGTSTNAAVTCTPSSLRSSMTIDATRRAVPRFATGRPRFGCAAYFHRADLCCGPVSSTAWGYGLMTVVAAGPVEGAILDTWYPEPALGRPSVASVAPPGLTALTGTRESAKDRGVKLAVVLTEIDLTSPPADVPDAYLPSPPVTPARSPARSESRRDLWCSQQRRLDVRRTLQRRRLRADPPGTPAARAGAGLRRRQVPPHGRLRGAGRCPDRRCGPRAARSAPGFRHYGHARRLC